MVTNLDGTLMIVAMISWWATMVFVLWWATMVLILWRWATLVMMDNNGLDIMIGNDWGFSRRGALICCSTRRCRFKVQSMMSQWHQQRWSHDRNHHQRLWHTGPLHTSWPGGKERDSQVHVSLFHHHHRIRMLVLITSIFVNQLNHKGVPSSLSAILL